MCDVLLSHLEARSDEEGRLAFRGASLFTGTKRIVGRSDASVYESEASIWLQIMNVENMRGGSIAEGYEKSIAACGNCPPALFTTRSRVPNFSHTAS